MGRDSKGVVHVTEVADRMLDWSVKCRVQKSLHIQVCNCPTQLWTHSHHISLFVELISEAERGGNLNMAERPQSVSSKCPLRRTKASFISYLVENETSKLNMLSLVSARRQLSMRKKSVRLFMRVRTDRTRQIFRQEVGRGPNDPHSLP
jgi:hypothetical protein